jgi:hypothetical protein
MCECSNEPFDFIEGGEFLYQLRDCQLLKKGSVLCSYLVSSYCLLVHLRVEKYLNPGCFRNKEKHIHNYFHNQK